MKRKRKKNRGKEKEIKRGRKKRSAIE